MTTITVRVNAIESLRVSTCVNGWQGVIVECVADFTSHYAPQYVASSGGAWVVTQDGFLGRQIRGTADIAAPSTPLTVNGVRAWAREAYPNLQWETAR